MQHVSGSAGSAISNDDDQICQMLGSLNLQAWTETTNCISVKTSLASMAIEQPGSPLPLVHMMDDTQAQSSRSPSPPPSHGCEILQSLRPHLHSSDSSNTFLQAILQHRESFIAFPAAHRGCAAVFTELAFQLEMKAQESGEDGDLHAAMALDREAWLVSGWN
ncbi:hypothetical protein BD410DRAFT_845125 [Rickenella mellea]|uniref:Uncharacterized protein n=1 Tax=Rickenella mellea TaxID=50990 RepID=A0A4Y7PJG3_9AGAM|nr:hypothetical protein BD410DRAFT_845125 [Rickenella mellea]